MQKAASWSCLYRMLKLVSSRKNWKGEKERDIISEHLQAKPETFPQPPRLLKPPVYTCSSRKSKIASVNRVRFQGDITAISRRDIARVSNVNLLKNECNFAAIFQWRIRRGTPRNVLYRSVKKEKKRAKTVPGATMKKRQQLNYIMAKFPIFVQHELCWL